MPLSARTKNILAAPFAVSHIMQRCWLPGVVGLLLLALGWWRDIGWLKVTGVLLAGPLIWVYAVVIFVLLPFALFDRMRRKARGQ
jgi:hypothetical protein